MFVYGQLLDELRCHTTEWLVARRHELVAQQRRLRVEELAVTAVLDERDAVDDSGAASDGVSVRSARDAVATARALKDLPEVAAAAWAGRLGDEQLAPVAKLADPVSDAEWAQRGEHTAPSDLRQMVRSARKPSMEEMRARRAAREHRYWIDRRTGMLEGRYSIPDLDGALVQMVFTRMVEKMRPAKGQRWASFPHRAADALVDLCRNYSSEMAVETPSWDLHVEVRADGPATVGGIPLADEVVESLLAQARVEPILVDERGSPVLVGKARGSGITAKHRRAVLRRDGHCRFPGGCDRTHGLQVHHLWPKSWGGGDELTNLVAVCAGGADHHGLLVPQGPHVLMGNPNRPDSLRLVHRDELSAIARLAGVEGPYHLGGNPAITDPARLDQYLGRIRAGPSVAA